MDWLLSFDESLFGVLNGQWHNTFLDSIMPYWRNKYFWIPAYVFLIGYLLMKHQKKGLLMVAFAGLTVGVADITSSKIIKPTVQRLRPCHEAEIAPYTRNLVHCGRGYSFPSSHATNHFALAVFIIGLLGTSFPKIKVPLLLWATSISYGQVYVGVHYPVDVFCGAVLGGFIGWLMYRFYLNMDKRFFPSV